MADLSLGDVVNVLFLRDYNTRLVVACTLLLGAACGLMGGFLLLRKRSLMGDTLSHAMLPGVGLAFLVSVLVGVEGKSLLILLFGAAVTGALGCGCVLFIRSQSRIKDDAAMGIVLSVFFGAGVVVLGFVQSMPEGSAAGLGSFIYGKTASMLLSDFQVLSLVTVCALAASVLLFKEFRLICFDDAYAASQGWPVKRLDALLLALVTVVTVAGLQAVGLILIIAFLITPAAAARFWTERLDAMLRLSVLIGGICGWLGASISALLPRMPAGAVIVLVAAAVFMLSLFFGIERGILVRWARQRELQRKVGRQHLLRGIYETLETSGGKVVNASVSMRELQALRTWSDRGLQKVLRQAYADGLLESEPTQDPVRLTAGGFAAAAQVTRNHRLWEIYLIEYADVATSRVDRDADMVEHILGDHLVAALEKKLATFKRPEAVPASPHPIATGQPEA